MAKLKSLRNGTIMLTLFFILLSLAVGFIVGRYLGRPIMLASLNCDQIASGDFSISVDEAAKGRGDEIGALTRGFDKIINNFNDILGQLKNTSNHMLKSSQAMNNATQTVAATMQQVSASTQQISSGLQTVSDQLNKCLPPASRCRRLSQCLLMKPMSGRNRQKT